MSTKICRVANINRKKTTGRWRCVDSIVVGLFGAAEGGPQPLKAPVAAFAVEKDFDYFFAGKVKGEYDLKDTL